jgi:hypothetical protein
MAKTRFLFGVWALAIAGLALGAKATDYAGLWKRNCVDEFGLQITPLRDGLYAISFCNHDGCSRPGVYRPNTRIENDPMYEVLSATRIKVRYQDGGYSMYVRCAAGVSPALLPR